MDYLQPPKEDSMAAFLPGSKASVIIVRDFDKPLDVDKGFQQKILKLAETSKSPFILICGKSIKQSNFFSICFLLLFQSSSLFFCLFKKIY